MVIVQDEELQDLFRMLYSKVEIPSATTLTRDVKLLYRMSREALKGWLQVRISRTMTLAA